MSSVEKVPLLAVPPSGVPLSRSRPFSSPSTRATTPTVEAGQLLRLVSSR